MYMLCVMHKGNICKCDRVKNADIPLHALFLVFFVFFLFAICNNVCR